MFINGKKCRQLIKFKFSTMAKTNPPDGGGSDANENTSVRHRVARPPKEGLLKEFKSVVQETFFHDAPLRDFKDQTASKKVLLGIQAVFPIIGWAREYNLRKLRGDVISGLTIASLCIPQVYYLRHHFFYKVYVHVCVFLSLYIHHMYVSWMLGYWICKAREFGSKIWTL